MRSERSEGLIPAPRGPASTHPHLFQGEPQEAGPACAEPASRRSAPRSGGGQAPAHAVGLTRDYQSSVLPTDSAEDPESERSGGLTRQRTEKSQCGGDTGIPGPARGIVVRGEAAWHEGTPNRYESPLPVAFAQRWPTAATRSWVGWHRGVEFGAESANLGELPCCQRNSMNPARGHDQFRMQLWSGFYKTTWASYGQVRGCSHESFRHAPRRTRDAHLNRRARAGRAEHSSRRRRSERRRVLPLAASNGGARHREPVAVRRRGRSVCCGGPGRQWDAACGVDRTRSRHRDRCNDNPPPERG